MSPNFLPSTDASPSLSRRAFLTTVGVGIAGGLAGCLGGDENRNRPSGGSSGIGTDRVPREITPSINPENLANQFDETVIATDVGADPTGEQPIDGVLNSYAEPGTLLVFPEGTYTMASPYRHTGGGDLGIIGQNATIRHARVDSISGHTITGGAYSGETILFAIGRASSPHSGTLVLGGFNLDYRAQNTGMQLLRLYTTGVADVRNIQILGQQDLGTRGPFRVLTRGSEAVAMLRNIDMRHGALHASRTINSRTSGLRDPSWSTSGFTIGPSMSGTLLLENIICGAYPDNGLYAKGGTRDSTVGRKIVRNCTAANSNVANIRVNSGPNWSPHPLIDGSADAPAQGYERTVVEDCHVIVDATPSEAYGNQRGIRLDDGDPILRNTTVELHNPNGHAINVQQHTDGATVENCQIDLYQPEIAIRVSGTNATIRDNVVTMYGFQNPARVLSGISPGAGVAVEHATQSN